MMTKYSVVDKMVKFFKKKIAYSNTDKTYPFFYPRIVKDDYQEESIWLGEDYSFCWLARHLKEVVHGYISPTIGHLLTTEHFVTKPKSFVWPKKSITVYCGNTAAAWSPNDLKKGIGGSEQAIIYLTRYWASKGWYCTVFCNCDEPKEYDGVHYRSVYDFNIPDEFGILILWRSALLSNVVGNLKADKIYVDLHDVPNPQMFTKEGLKQITAVCVKSKHHASLLDKTVPDEKIVVIPNGGAQTSKEEVKRDPYKLIYASSYDRGLGFMLKYGWPIIQEKVPQARLHIFYGWDMYDEMTKMSPEADTREKFKNRLNELMLQDGIIHHGKVSVEKLLQEKKTANIHYYVGDFNEIDCITVRESASLGVIPVVSSEVGVFKEKDYCLQIEGNPRDSLTQVKGANKIVELLLNPEQTEEIRQTLIRPESKLFLETWNNVADNWITLFDM